MAKVWTITKKGDYGVMNSYHLGCVARRGGLIILIYNEMRGE